MTERISIENWRKFVNAGDKRLHELFNCDSADMKLLGSNIHEIICFFDDYADNIADLRDPKTDVETNYGHYCALLRYGLMIVADLYNNVVMDVVNGDSHFDAECVTGELITIIRCVTHLLIDYYSNTGVFLSTLYNDSNYANIGNDFASDLYAEGECDA